jgi:hypothetical protein
MGWQGGSSPASVWVCRTIDRRVRFRRYRGGGLLNTLCISYGYIHGQGLVLFQVGMGSFFYVPFCVIF